MRNFKLNISLLPKGAWNNDLSKTLPKKDWDTLREFCYKKATHRCEICGIQTDELDAHEVWEFNKENKTQTLKDIIAVCTKCHGVVHFKNSARLGFGEQAKEHFMKVNNASELEFAGHLSQAITRFEELNSIYRWKIIANLKPFGGENIELKTNTIPIIINPYESIKWENLNISETNKLFKISTDGSLIGAPKAISINVDNYQGVITIDSLFTDSVEWFLDDAKIKTKYNTIGKFKTSFSVKGLTGKILYFRLFNEHGSLTSKDFILEKYD